MGAKTTIEIAEWVCKTGYNDFGFNSNDIKYINGLALSHIGMALAGSTMTFGKMVIDYAKEFNSSADAGVINGGFLCSTEYAALANGAAAHTTELEDNSWPESIYSCGGWPTPFALAEKLKLSGKDVIEAFVIGWEVAGRLGVVAAGATNKGWAIFSSFLSIGCAVMAAKMLKLNVEQTACAISLAASQAAGIARQTGTGAHLIEAGFNGRNGICAAKLAKVGYTGSQTILEGRAGYMDLLADRPEFELPLGDGWRVMEIGMKKYPCCWLGHLGIDTTFDLIKEHNIKWDDVESVTHHVNNTFPLYLKYVDPQTGEDARFSIQHNTVCCFFDKKVFLDSFTDKKARDPKYVEARKKVHVKVHPEYPEGHLTWRGPVIIKMKNGKVFEKLRDGIKGLANDKLNQNEVMQKYNDCIGFAGILTHEKAEKIADMIWSLDKIKDVSGLCNELTYLQK
jgi:2-methylcitrate dehydratase PrpD